MTVSGASRLRTTRLASVLLSAVIVLGGTIALSPAAAAADAATTTTTAGPTDSARATAAPTSVAAPATTAEPTAEPTPSATPTPGETAPAPAEPCTEPAVLEGDVSVLNYTYLGLWVTLPAATATGCFDDTTMTVAVTGGPQPYSDVQTVDLPFAGGTFWFTVPVEGTYDVSVQSFGGGSPTAHTAYSGTAVVEPACPGDAEGVVSSGAPSYDWSVAGTVTVTLPAFVRAGCADDAGVSVSLRETGALGEAVDAPNASVAVDIPAGGYPGGSVELTVPWSGYWTVVTDLTMFKGYDGGVWTKQIASDSHLLYADAWEQCVWGSSFGTDVLTAEGGVDAAHLSVATDALPSCVSAARIRLESVRQGDGSVQDLGWYDLPLGGGVTTADPALDAGTYTIQGRIFYTVDGVERDGTWLFATDADGSDILIDVTAAAASANTGTTNAAVGNSSTGRVIATVGSRSLASTGVDPLVPVGGGAILLALGVLGLVVARRRAA